MRGESRRGSSMNACKTLVGPKNARSATRDSLASRFELPLLGSNQDSPDPESGVLPVTPRGSGAEGARTPDLLGAIQALSQLSYSPARSGNLEAEPLLRQPLKSNRRAPIGRGWRCVKVGGGLWR